MKYWKFIFLFAVIACSSPKIFYDYDADKNFNNYKSFGFSDGFGKGMSEFEKKRLFKEIRYNLVKKGLKEEVINPDFYINATSNVYENPVRNNIGIGLSGGAPSVNIGVSGGIPIRSKKLIQELKIDFLERKNNSLIWQSISNSELKHNISATKKDNYYKVLVGKIISGFPPKK